MGEVRKGPSKRPDFLDPVKEAQAVASLRASIAALNEDDELLADTIEGETSLNEVVDRVLDRMRDAEVIVDGVDAAVAKLNERKRRAEEGIKRDRALLEQALTIAGLDSLPRPTATLTVRQGTPQLVITEESEIPAAYWKAGDPKLDKKALGEALKARAAALAAIPAEPGEARDQALAAFAEAFPDIPGATLSNGAPTLQIRVK
jgi:hypothetical protein